MKIATVLSSVLFTLSIFGVAGSIVLKTSSLLKNDKPELILQTGHSNFIQAVVFAPDDQWVATGSFDNSIRIWDLESGRELRALFGHRGAVRSIACSPDGKMLASGGNDGSVKVWDAASGDQLKGFEYEGEAVESIAFSHDGRTLAYSGTANNILIRDTQSWAIVGRLVGHTGSVTALAFSPDDRRLVSGSSDRNLTLWDLEKKKPTKKLSGNTDAIASVTFDRTGDLIVSGGRDNSVRLWKTSNGREFATVKSHSREILHLAFDSNNMLNSADRRRVSKVWDPVIKRETLSADRPESESMKGEAESAVFSNNGRYLAFGNGDGTVGISDARTGLAIQLLENHTVSSYAVAFSPNMRWLAAASSDNTIKLWDLQSGESLQPLSGHTGRVTSVLAHPDNRRIISSSLDGSIRVWDTILLKELNVLNGHAGSVGALAISRSGNLLVSGGTDKSIGIWNPDELIEKRFLKKHTGEVIAVAISADERLIASGGSDSTFKIWDAATGEMIRSVDMPSGEVNAVVFSPGTKLVASGGSDRVVRIWDIETGKLVRSLSGHSAAINTLLFSADGTRLVSSGRDKTIRTWNVADGMELTNVSGHAGTVFSLSLSSDQRFMASASEDGSIIIWDTKTTGRLATLISLKESSDWLVVTPDGFFDGSQPAWQRLAWRFEKNTFNIQPIEVFFSEFWMPGLLGKIIGGGTLPSSTNISSKDRRLPVVKLRSLPESRDGNVDARIRHILIDVSQAPAGAKDVRLFRNGTMVKMWRSDVLKGQTNVVLEAAVPIVAGKNQFIAYAFNSDDVKSKDSTLFIDGPSALHRKGIAYILSVGVNKYSNAEFDLTYAASDGRSFADEFKTRQLALGNFEQIDIIRLTDDQATKANILKSLAELSAKIKPEDSLIFYFAGHGTAQNNRFYLILHDIGYAGRRDLIDPAGLNTILAHGISDEELEAVVEGIDVANFILVIDACNSGQALEAEEKRRGPMNSRGLAQLAYEKGMYILTAAQGFQAAKEDSRLGYGYLTFALVEEGLKTGEADRKPKDGQVLLREWLDFAADRVPQIDKEELERGKKKTRQLEREKEKGKGLVREEIIFQRPRVFYRRETEKNPLIVARP